MIKILQHTLNELNVVTQQNLYKTKPILTIKMAKDNKINMPSGQGGITRYFEESVSKIEISPSGVIVLAAVIMVIILLLHQFGGNLLG